MNRVQWTLKDGTIGIGTVIGEKSDDSTHVLVAVDPLPEGAKCSQASKEFHPVIWCTRTWLTEIA